MPHTGATNMTDESLIEILLDTDTPPPEDEDIDTNMVRLAIEKTLEEHHYLGRFSITVLITDNAHIRSLNKQFRGRDEVTDILSFNEDEGWHEGEKNETKDDFLARGNPSRLGDLVVAIRQVKMQAAKEGRDWREELAMLTVHGTLHLLGYDHEEENEAIRMFGLTERIMAKTAHILADISTNNQNITAS